VEKRGELFALMVRKSKKGISFFEEKERENFAFLAGKKRGVGQVSIHDHLDQDPGLNSQDLRS